MVTLRGYSRVFRVTAVSWKAGSESETTSLLQAVADDLHAEPLFSKPVDMVKLKLGRLHMQSVVFPGNDRGYGESAVAGEFRDLSFPGAGQHVADLADSVLHRVVYLVEGHSRHKGGGLGRSLRRHPENACTAQPPAEADYRTHRVRLQRF